MSNDKDKYTYAERLLGGIFGPLNGSLREVFDKRIAELGLSQKAVQAELDIEYRALTGILNGTQKNVDLLALSRLADFLQMPVEKLVGILIEKLEYNFSSKVKDAGKQEFITKKFDLAKLKKLGIIDSISDFNLIENQLIEYFGLNSIYEYGKDFINVAYSSGKPKPKDSLMLDFWGESATRKLKKIDNHNDYDRAGLIEYIPSIRWYSTDVNNGLYQVIRELYKYGVTVIYEPYLTTIYIRGATFPVNDKPCIVLTNYTDYYSSLWFSLIHEIHHVLFDWEEIRVSKPHLSGWHDKYDKKEIEADTFAREYLFSSDKMKVLEPQINNEAFVKRYANAFDVHPSLIYSAYCWVKMNAGEDVYKYYQKYLGSAKQALVKIDPDSFDQDSRLKRVPIRERTNKLVEGVFNGL